MPEALATVIGACNDASGEHGDPTEVALLDAAGAAPRPDRRLATFAFDPRRKLMSTVDAFAGELWLDVKGAPDELLERCTHVLVAGTPQPLEPAARARVAGEAAQTPRAG